MVAFVAARGTDIVSKRQERRALFGSYSDLLESTRAEVDDLRTEIERQRGFIGVLRRRIAVLRSVIVQHNIEVPPDPDNVDF